MQINELFYSIQGEGILIGVPHVFIRLAGCNLACKWCDTKYAWVERKEMTEEEILKQVLGYPTKYVCITGGEPLIQNIEPLLEKLKSLGYFITIETNCTLFKEELLPYVDLWSLSPKFASSGNEPNMEVLKKFIEKAPSEIQIKFVISTKEDYLGALDVMKSSPAISEKQIPIIFQPEYYSKNLKDLVDDVLSDIAFKDFEIRVLPQLHKVVWGERRGV